MRQPGRTAGSAFGSRLHSPGKFTLTLFRRFVAEFAPIVLRGILCGICIRSVPFNRIVVPDCQNYPKATGLSLMPESAQAEKVPESRSRSRLRAAIFPRMLIWGLVLVAAFLPFAALSWHALDLSSRTGGDRHLLIAPEPWPSSRCRSSWVSSGLARKPPAPAAARATKPCPAV